MALRFFLVFQFCELRFEIQQLGAEIREALGAFGRFGGDQLDVDAALVVVERAGERGQGGCELALESGIGAWAGCEGGEVGPDGFGLPEGGVIEGALVEGEVVSWGLEGGCVVWDWLTMVEMWVLWNGWHAYYVRFLVVV
jgi:hypothetical protein